MERHSIERGQFSPWQRHYWSERGNCPACRYLSQGCRAPRACNESLRSVHRVQRVSGLKSGSGQRKRSKDNDELADLAANEGHFTVHRGLSRVKESQQQHQSNIVHFHRSRQGRKLTES